jgi:3-hydroxyacyl-[acyl-carrier-protein] dehydratase
VAARAASPVTAEAELLAPDTVAFFISADEQVFAGHYPGFPIFPGVCVVECVHRGSLATAPDEAVAAGLELEAVDSARFLGAVHPGDRITVELRWKRSGDGWQSAAKVRGPLGDVASVRLRYRPGSPR